YDPNYDPVKIKLDHEKVESWLSKGAQPSRTVSWLIKEAKAGRGEAAPKAEATE
ncbi:30S ribosomal protein S16, partial [Thermodesulfobacteriota bacterium]